MNDSTNKNNEAYTKYHQRYNNAAYIMARVRLSDLLEIDLEWAGEMLTDAALGMCGHETHSNALRLLMRRVRRFATDPARATEVVFDYLERFQ